MSHVKEGNQLRIYWQMQKNNKKIKITLKKSLIGKLPKHKKSVYGLGLKRIGQQVEVEDTPSTRGMINKANYLLEVIE